MLNKRIIFLCVISWSAAIATAQNVNVWSLERCIDYAQKNSITIKQSQLSVRNSEIAVQQNKLAQYPDLNGNIGFSGNSGRSLDPSNYQIQQQTLGYNNFGLSSGVTLYNGGRIKKSIEQSKIDHEAAVADLEQTTQNAALSVASAYLQVLLASEQLENAKKRAMQSKEQLDQILKSIKAGGRPANDRYDFDAQLAKNEQNIVTQQNNVDISYLNLKQLLLLDPDAEFKIERPEIKIPALDELEGLSLKMIYLAAYSRQPQIKAGELRQKSKEIGIEIAKADLLPTVTASVNLGSNFATSTKTGVGTPSQNLTPAFPVVIGGVPTNFQQYREVYSSYKPISYFTQLNNNFNQSAGISVRIPIYNNGRAGAAIERAHLEVVNTQLQNQQTQNQLKTDIQRALADARAAKKQLEAAEKTFNAYKMTADNAEKKSRVGASTIFELTTANNNMDTAQRDVVVAKYDYLFKLKILDFYQGKRISLQ